MSLCKDLLYFTDCLENILEYEAYKWIGLEQSQYSTDYRKRYIFRREMTSGDHFVRRYLRPIRKLSNTCWFFMLSFCYMRIGGCVDNTILCKEYFMAMMHGV